jgi:prophage regulatory protein
MPRRYPLMLGHMMHVEPSRKSLLRLRQVREIIPLSRTEIYRRIALDQFPRPIKLGERVIAWDADVIQAYVREKIAAGEARSPVREIERILSATEAEQ